MQTRTYLNTAAPLVPGAPAGRLAASVRLAAAVPAEDKPAASTGLDCTVSPVFSLANQYRRWEFDDQAQRLYGQPTAAVPCKGLVPSPTSRAPSSARTPAVLLRVIDELPEEDEKPHRNPSHGCRFAGAELLDELGNSRVYSRGGLRRLPELLPEVRRRLAADAARQGRLPCMLFPTPESDQASPRYRPEERRSPQQPRLRFLRQGPARRGD